MSSSGSVFLLFVCTSICLFRIDNNVVRGIKPLLIWLVSCRIFSFHSTSLHIITFSHILFSRILPLCCSGLLDHFFLFRIICLFYTLVTTALASLGEEQREEYSLLFCSADAPHQRCYIYMKQWFHPLA